MDLLTDFCISTKGISSKGTILIWLNLRSNSITYLYPRFVLEDQ